MKLKNHMSATSTKPIQESAAQYPELHAHTDRLAPLGPVSWDPFRRLLVSLALHHANSGDLPSRGERRRQEVQNRTSARTHRDRATPSGAGAGASSAPEGGDYLVTVQYTAPCVLPWVWDVTPPSEHHLLNPHALALHAGAGGAPLPIASPSCHALFFWGLRFRV